MASINAHYTCEYSQPSEYHFSHDSVFLSRRVFEIHRADKMEEWAMLDLCSGCGVVGLDFLHHCCTEGRAGPRSVDFVEVQEIYTEHFTRNRKDFPNTQMHALNYRALLAIEWSKRFDLIVCNPPYFQVGQGALSPSTFKNRCRFFMDSDFSTLIRATANAIKVGGHAYCLMRRLKDHGIDPLQAARLALPQNCALEELGDIRGTSLLHLTKGPSNNYLDSCTWSFAKTLRYSSAP